MTITQAVQFDEGRGGLRRAVISTPLAEAELYLQGAHLTAWTPRGQRPVLFTSSQSLFEAGKPIRGGVPIAFPWFGPRGGGLPGPMHGVARIQEWSVESSEVAEDGTATLVLALAQAGEWRLRFRVAIGESLTMELTATNDSATGFTFEEALHTYFAIEDVHRVSVSGLAGVHYLDKTDEFREKVQGVEPIRIVSETDRVYLNTQATCVIDDGRKIVVGKSGSNTTVVWNPWIAKAAALPDLADDEWKQLICVETVNAGVNALTIAPGSSHTMTATVRIA